MYDLSIGVKFKKNLVFSIWKGFKYFIVLILTILVPANA